MTPHTQFSVFLVGRPDILTRVCRGLAEAKVNILALTMMDTTEHGVLRIVCSDGDVARDALKRMNCAFTENQVLAVEMPNRPGAAAEVCERLGAAKVGIRYMYCSVSGVAGGKALGIFRVANVDKARKALESKKKTSRQMKINRRAPSMRR